MQVSLSSLLSQGSHHLVRLPISIPDDQAVLPTRRFYEPCSRRRWDIRSSPSYCAIRHLGCLLLCSQQPYPGAPAFRASPLRAAYSELARGWGDLTAREARRAGCLHHQRDRRAGAVPISEESHATFGSGNWWTMDMASAGKVRMGRGVIGLVHATKRLDHRANLDVLPYPMKRSSSEGGHHSGGARKCWVRAGFTRCRGHDALCNQWCRHLAKHRPASASPVRVDAHNASPRAMNCRISATSSGNCPPLKGS